MTRDVWQSYDCPSQKTDADLEDGRLVYSGQPFHCVCCGGEHVAGRDVVVETFILSGDVTEYPALPETAQDLEALILGQIQGESHGVEDTQAQAAGLSLKP